MGQAGFEPVDDLIQLRHVAMLDGEHGLRHQAGEFDHRPVGSARPFETRQRPGQELLAGVRVGTYPLQQMPVVEQDAEHSGDRRAHVAFGYGGERHLQILGRCTEIRRRMAGESDAQGQRHRPQEPVFAGGDRVAGGTAGDELVGESHDLCDAARIPVVSSGGQQHTGEPADCGAVQRVVARQVLEGVSQHPRQAGQVNGQVGDVTALREQRSGLGKNEWPEPVPGRQLPQYLVVGRRYLRRTGRLDVTLQQRDQRLLLAAETAGHLGRARDRRHDLRNPRRADKTQRRDHGLRVVPYPRVRRLVIDDPAQVPEGPVAIGEPARVVQRAAHQCHPERDTSGPIGIAADGDRHRAKEQQHADAGGGDRRVVRHGQRLVQQLDRLVAVRRRAAALEVPHGQLPAEGVRQPRGGRTSGGRRGVSDPEILDGPVEFVRLIGHDWASSVMRSGPGLRGRCPARPSAARCSRS